jgi:uncharacterized membrane protein
MQWRCVGNFLRQLAIEPGLDLSLLGWVMIFVSLALFVKQQNAQA